MKEITRDAVWWEEKRLRHQEAMERKAAIEKDYVEEILETTWRNSPYKVDKYGFVSKDDRNYLGI